MNIDYDAAMNTAREAANRVCESYRLDQGNVSMRDFRRICKAEGITVDYMNIAIIGGLIYRVKGRAFIVLRSGLRGGKRRLVAFHELGHYFMHSDFNTVTQMSTIGDIPVASLQSGTTVPVHEMLPIGNKTESLPPVTNEGQARELQEFEANTFTEIMTGHIVGAG